MNEVVYSHGLEGFGPVQCLAEGRVLPVEALPQVVNYADALTDALAGELQRPRIAVALVRNITTSIAGLASEHVDAIRAIFEDFDDDEYTAPAALALGLDLIERRRAVSVADSASTAKAVEVAAAREWNDVQDVIASLSTVEGRLVDLGAAALRHAPVLAARFAEDDDSGSYADAAGDVQRRIDYIGDPPFAPYFAKVKLTGPLVAEATSLLRDARVFRQAREGRLAESVALTRRRNALFTGWQVALDSLQKALRLSFADRPDVLAKVDASYWWNVSRLGRRASGPADEAPEVPSEAPADPLAPQTA